MLFHLSSYARIHLEIEKKGRATDDPVFMIKLLWHERSESSLPPVGEDP
jgi:hypothetical protein